MSSVRYPTRVTPIVSSASRVRGRSRMTFGPEQTTIICVCASSNRSAETSMLASNPRCTPPMPPVAKTSIPARRARIMVADTVVAPSAGVPAALDSATGRSRRDSFFTPLSVASLSIAASSRPACGLPSITAMVAGSAPAAPGQGTQSRSGCLSSILLRLPACREIRTRFKGRFKMCGEPGVRCCCQPPE